MILAFFLCISSKLKQTGIGISKIYKTYNSIYGQVTRHRSFVWLKGMNICNFLLVVVLTVGFCDVLISELDV